ncbi:MAG: polyisoprenoid-binding protein [Phycisphaera sp.]|nr:polyisoprenoid-binding protein [Phycisphaera sp.]
MRKVLTWAVAVIGVMGLGVANLHAQGYSLDTAHTAVVFKIKHMGYSHTYGRFNDIAGSITTGDAPSFEFTIKTASVDTHNDKRDEHLRSPDFFNVRQFPVITFKSTKATPTDTGYDLEGDLTLMGVTKPLTVKLVKNAEGKDPWGKERDGFDTEFTIKRSDFGMDKMLENIGDDVHLYVSFEGIK